MAVVHPTYQIKPPHLAPKTEEVASRIPESRSRNLTLTLINV
jgi:hypothetical protein